MLSAILTATIPLLLATVMFAQQPAVSPTPKPAVVDDGRDDILILVHLTANELKFDAVPDPKVEFPGTHDRSTVWVTDRVNLPDKVEPGVTYRNIGINLRISSRFADIDRIVREALGEEPATGPTSQAVVPSPDQTVAVGAPPAKAPQRIAGAKRVRKNP